MAVPYWDARRAQVSAMSKLGVAIRNMLSRWHGSTDTLAKLANGHPANRLDERIPSNVAG